MELSSLVGIICAFGVLIGGFTIAHIPYSKLLNVEALVIILGGTITAVTMAFPGKHLKKIPKLFKVVFTSKKTKSNVEIIQSFTEFSAEARKHGMLALEPKLEEIDDPFMKRGVGLVIDGQADPEFIRSVLEEEIGN